MTTAHLGGLGIDVDGECDPYERRPCDVTGETCCDHCEELAYAEQDAEHPAAPVELRIRNLVLDYTGVG